MQTKSDTPAGSLILYAGLSAVLAGLCYTSRWAWELSEGILKNKPYPPSFVTQNFFVVKILMAFALTVIFQLLKKTKRTRTGVLAACAGLLWTSIARTLEAYGAPGPWGFYSSPGLLLFFLGSLFLAQAVINVKPLVIMGSLLAVTSILCLSGGLSSMVLFNLLGRTDNANITASFVANLFFIAEGVCWIVLGVRLLLFKTQTNAGTITGVHAA